MGSTNLSKTAYVAETTKGTTPATPAFQEMRVTSNGLRYDPDRKTSNEIRSDRQVTDQILTGLSSGGNIGFELSFSAFDDMLQAAFQGTWTAQATIVNATADTEISDVGTAVITVASGGTAFKVGHLAVFTGFTTAANNDIIRRVSSSLAASVTFPASSFTAEATVPVGARMRVVGFEGASGDIVATTTGGNAWTSTLLDFTTLGLAVGMWIKGGGDAAGNQWATAADNGWYRISAIAANRLSFGVVPTGFAADTGTAKTIQAFFGDFLTTGTTQRAFTFERQQQDLTSPTYELFKGQEVNTLSLSLSAGEIITGSIGLIGMSATAPSTSRFAGATDVDPPEYSVLNAASNVGTLARAGVTVTSPSYFTELGFELNNNLAGQRAIGTQSNVGVRNGEISVGGPLKAYFGDETLLAAVINDTETSLQFRAGQTDENRLSLFFDIPRVKLTGTSDIGGKNQDRMFDGRYDAMRHEDLGFTASCGRHWYLPASA